MALSNYDSCAVDLTGAPCEPTYTSRWGLQVVIYKNWVYLRHPDMWQPQNGGFVHPTIAQIQEGEIKVGSVTVHATRGPRQGVYVAVYDRAYDSDTGEFFPDAGMVGCGVYLHGDSECIGEEEIDFLASWLKRLDDDAFTGVDLSRARRHNQGDAFFAGQYGVPTPDGAPGESDRPLLHDALAGWQARMDAAGEED